MLLRMTAFPFYHSEPSPIVILSLPPIVILSEAKNLFSCLKGTVLKILRSEAPQNDREGEIAPQNDREEEIRSSE